MVNAETLIIDPPDHVVSIFDYVMLKLTETDTLEEKKALREELINEEEHKVLGLIFQEGEVNVYLAITGIKRAINIAYSAIPIELCNDSGNTEVVNAPNAVPKAHPP